MEGRGGVFVLKMAALQQLDVILVDLERGAEADGQTGQHVCALHQQQGFTVYLLGGGREKGG